MVLMKAYGISRSTMYGGNGSNGGKPVEEDIQPTMTAMGAGAVCVGNGQLHQTELGDRTGTLNCMHDQQAIITEGKLPRKYIIRRMTPTECARLQGFPDWWTDGAEGSDSAKYKLWGNGIALPCAEDVIGRCEEELRRQKNAESDAGRGDAESGAEPEEE